MGIPADGPEQEVALREIEAEEKLKEMAHRCSVASGGKRGSAKVLYEEDMLAIYRMAASR